MIVKQVLKKGKKVSFVIMLLLGLFATNEVKAQNKTTVISGLVKDDTGMPIPGVNVVEKGTKNSTSSDMDGKYNLRISGSKSELVFSFIGFETLTQAVGQKTVLNVVLKNAASKLDEVVVIGYGTSRKSDLTGSVASISGADLKKVPVANVAEALTGRIAGVQVTSSEGSPDSEIKIRIRGGGSVSQDSSPLIIVDGFPVNSMSDISPSDIDSYTILKDASSTAIYGSRGAYGVIIITTKSGSKNSKMSVNYNVFYGAKTIANYVDVLNPEDFAKWQYEYAMLTGNPKGSTKEYDKYFAPYQSYAGVEGTNWQKEIFGRTGKVQSHDLGIRGGSDKINYNFNYALYDESSILLGSDFRRNNLSLNLKNKASDKVDLSFTMRYANTVINGGGANEKNEVSSQDSRLKHVIGYAPIDLPGLTTDDTDEAVGTYLTNPYVAIADNDRKQIRNNFNMLGSFSWKIVTNLQFKSDFGLDVYDNLDYRFYGRSTYYVKNIPSAVNQGKPALVMSDEKNNRFRNANTLNYDFKEFLGKNHNLKLLLGQEMIVYHSNKVTSTIHAYPKSFTFDDAMNLTSQGLPQFVNNYYSPDDKLFSLFGRVNYDFKNRYLFTATYRADGSSKFLGNNRWGYFPSAAVAWKVSEENFLKDVSWVNLLKMRLSYGEAGNNNIPVGQTIRTFQSSTSAWINNVSNFWAASRTMPNPDLKWETMVTQDLGFDFGLFKNRISGTVDVYHNITKDLLINFPVSGSGYDTQYRNMGENQNKGLEVTLNLVALDKEDYGLSFNFNIGFNKNKINSLGIMNDFGISSGWASTAIGSDYPVRVGQPIGLMIGYQNDGRYEISDFTYNTSTGAYTLKPYFLADGVTRNPDGVATNTNIVGSPVPGSMKLKDINGDGKVDVNDITVIGNSNPKNTGGLVVNANVHQFDFMAAFNWSYGNDAYNANKIEFTTTVPNGQNRNLTSEMADGNRWTNLDPTTGLLVTDPAALTALNANTTMWSPKMDRFVFSDWAVEDASFFRLNTFTIGYTAPDALVSKLGITKLRFYQTMSNVFTATHYSGPDPEVSTRRDTPYTPGVDYSAYPRSRQIVFGLNLTF